MIAAPQRLFTVEEYHRLAEVGVLHEDDRVELLNGIIINMMPIGPFHGSSVKRLTHVFESANNGRWITSAQDPIQIGEHSAPQPDLALLHLREDYYLENHPGPQDVYLLIEVSDSTLLVDREEKLPIYARAGIAEVWIVNLPERVVEVYSSPTNGAYVDCRRVRAGDALAPFAFPDAAIDTAALLQPKA